MIKNVNTVEEYRNMDRPHLLHQAGQMVGITITGCLGEWYTYTNEKLQDMGCYPRRNNTLMPLPTLQLCDCIFCGPQKIQVPLLVCISGNPLRSSMGPRATNRSSIPVPPGS